MLVALAWSFKTRSCCRLDSLIVHAWQVFVSWIVLSWILKNGEVFQTPPTFCLELADVGSLINGAYPVLLV